MKRRHCCCTIFAMRVRIFLVGAGIAFLVLSLDSCFTGLINTRMDRVFQNEVARPKDFSLGENINGFFPLSIVIKTATQTFNQKFSFLLYKNRIYYKSNDAAGEIHDWTIFRKTGLPENRLQRGFKKPAKIVAISADDNELQAMSDKGQIYQYVFNPGLMLQDYFWNDKMGWPETTPLVLNDMVRNFRSWAVAKRTSSVLWYEDRFGNQHHYGTMGIENSFFLCENGQDIRFTDTGLPSDFSHMILGPERGKVIAESLSASALTMFIITDSGEMYTRLADFDTLGSDPLFYLYTYRNEKSDIPGSDYRSNFTPWGLPSEEWKKQPAIPVVERVRVTKRITILQNGQGNESRELRVAGIDRTGRVGYFYKQLNDPAWLFREAPLELSAADYLDRTLVEKGASPRGPSSDIAYTGRLWLKNREQTDLELSIPDFNIGEGSCHLVVTRGRESAELLVHPVDAWTYVRRYDPGRDKTPKLFMTTFEIPSGAFDSLSPEFRAILNAVFASYDRTVFDFTAEATTEYLLIKQSSAWKNDVSLFLTRKGSVAEINPDIVRKISIGTDALIMESVSDDLKIPGIAKPGFSDTETIGKCLERNKAFKVKIEDALSMYKMYRISSAVSGKAYSLFDRFTRVTKLDQINFPKIYTATLHGSAVMQNNADNLAYTTNAKLWMYEKTLQIVDIRIQMYGDILAALEKKEPLPSKAAQYRESFGEYYRQLGLPAQIAGTWLPDSAAVPCIIAFEPVSEWFSGLVIISRNDPSERFLVDFMNLPLDVFNRRSNDFSLRPLVTAVSVVPQIMPGTARRKELPVLKNNIGYQRIPGVEPALRLVWDGTTLTIFREAPLEKRTIIFTTGLISSDSSALRP